MKKRGITEKIKKVFSYLWNQVILPNLIWTVLIGVPSAVVFAVSAYATITQYISSAKIQYLPLTICIVAFAVNLIVFLTGIVYLIYYIRHRNPPADSPEPENTPKFPELNFDYRVKSAEYELFFETREKINQRQTICLEVLCDQLKEISHNMTWTGQKYIKSQLASGYPGVKLIDTTRTSSPYPVKVVFDHTLHRGDTASYKFSTDVEDISKTMMPFLSKVIKCQTEKLILRVTAPKGMIKNPEFRITTDYLADVPLDAPKAISPKVVGNYDSFECEIDNIELLRCYCIYWEF